MALNNRNIDQAHVDMAFGGLKLAPIRNSEPSNDQGGSRRSSAISLASIGTFSGPSSPMMTPPTSEEDLHRAGPIRRVRQVENHLSPYPEPSVGPKAKKIKAEREKDARREQARCFGAIQEELYQMNPDIGRLANPKNGHRGLRDLKQNNVNKDLADPLLHNKVDVLWTFLTAFRDSTEVIETSIGYLQNMNKPGAVQPEQMAAHLSKALANRGCVTFRKTKI